MIDAVTVIPFHVPGQQSYGNSVFPYGVRCMSTTLTRSDTELWIAGQRKELLRSATQHGAILFRDFPLKTAEDFDAFVTSLGISNFPYRQSLSNAVRKNRTERVFTANEAPPEVTILFHHEMAQTPIYPEWILFFCELAAQEGGATPICRSDILYDRLKELSPQFVTDCERKGLKYSNVMPEDDDLQSGMGRSWKGTLGVETRIQAERRLQELNYSWQWLDDGSLRVTTPALPAVKEIQPGRKSFFNQLIAAFLGWKDSRNTISESLRHGDGTQLDRDAVLQTVALAEELAFDLHWQAGDVVLIDNTVVMHARRTFKGPRQIMASLAEMRHHALIFPDRGEGFTHGGSACQVSR
ncbi:TauD/TfdA family dioxygenase [Planctomicrobium sp. SH661]|uniref:TauD/TfdA family dioxygenase n=1 Tax=Planctomicrobium sp. SH661 TaxID=3448124 RepID=UPI003F5C2E94